MIFSRQNKRADQPQRRLQTDTTEESTVVRSGFRRNQTLSGIRRYQDGTSERTRLHHLARRRRHMGGVFGLVLATIVFLALLLTQFIARVEISGTTQVLSRAMNTKVYEALIDEYLAVHPVERLRFLLNTQALTVFVSSERPEVSSIALGGLRQLTDGQFTVTFREPIAGWQINSRQYYVDKDGVVFETTYVTPPRVQIVDQSGISPDQGTAVVSARLLSFVGRAVALAGEGGYTVSSVTLPAGTTRQLELRITDVAPYIRFSIDRAVGEQVEDMIRSVEYLRSRGVSPEYIDVRVEGRAIYR